MFSFIMYFCVYNNIKDYKYGNEKCKQIMRC